MTRVTELAGRVTAVALVVGYLASLAAMTVDPLHGLLAYVGVIAIAKTVAP